MKTQLALISALLVVTACSGGPTQTSTPKPTAAPTPIVTPTPTSPPAATPAPTITAVSARVTFDGSTCTYTGPTVLPFPASLTIDSQPTPAQESSWVTIVAIRSDTTEAQLNDPNPGASIPSWVYYQTHLTMNGSGQWEFRSYPSGLNPMAQVGADGKPRYDTYQVTCWLPTSDGPVGDYTILRLVQ